jgi:hypothetical protein
MEIFHRLASGRGIMTGATIDKVPEIRTRDGPRKILLPKTGNSVSVVPKKTGEIAMGFPMGILRLSHALHSNSYISRLMFSVF